MLASLYSITQVSECRTSPCAPLNPLRPQYALIGVIVVLVIMIGKMLLVKPAASTRAVYKPKRKPAKIFVTKSELLQYDGSDSS